MIRSPNTKPLIAGFVLVLLCCCASVAAYDKSWSGKCVGIADGDTIRVVHAGKEIKIRLYGIDCPEMGQDFGNRARQFTSEMAFGKMVRIEEVDCDRYGRPVAWVWVDGQSLNTELVKAGLAWWYRHFAPGDTELKDLEAKAREAKIGLWSHPKPIPPWVFRKSQWPN